MARTYPMIALWASGYGWVEFGIDGLDRPFVRALDEGGLVWEGQGRYKTLDEALWDLEDGLARFMEEEGLMRKLTAQPKTPGRAGKKPRGARVGSEKVPHRTDDHPAIKKVEKLEAIAEALRRGEQFSITRLTTIKGLCDDAKAAGAFALFLARKVQKKMRENQGEKRYRALVNRGVKEMKSFLDDPSEERRVRLHSLYHEMVGEQNEHRNISWGAVRIIHSRDLLVAEKALRAILEPDEAPSWLYHAARDYSERYNPRFGNGLIPDSVPMVEEIAGFWRKHYGVQR